MQRTVRAAVSLGISLLFCISGSLVLATSASAGTVEDEQVFITLINQTRANQGLPPLIVHGELAAEARAWAASMAANDRLAHTPNMAKGISVRWTVLGENVGVHGIHEPAQLFEAFLASPSHYQNLVDPRFQYVGVGVVHDQNGKLWTTHRFMAVAAPPETTTTSPPTTAPPVKPPTTAPPTTAPPATKPPTTAPPAAKPPKTSPVAPNPTSAPTTATTAGKPAPTTSAPPTPKPAPSDSPGTTGPGDPSPSSDPAGDDPIDPAELVKPDVSTIEEVLIDLVEAGI